ncbi:MAG: aminotransferase class I/II-fold pyridoxal phosphate-dependent enzyme [Planctomycetota bacterium]|nr:aminotransferase class I/II-fold pyridoxal phosphate-dependent enzyme [Planctomycetota bacterium]
MNDSPPPATGSRFGRADWSIARVCIGLARGCDRGQIYRLRHAVYARELGQHLVNGQGDLRDDLDGFNTYLVARIGPTVAGFVSITPPPNDDAKISHRYSIDKYVQRDQLPFDFDDGVYEIRLLTVAEAFRGSKLASLLMYAALRWVEGRGGRRIVALGRREVMGLYRKIGLQPLGIIVRSGDVTFELMTATVDTLQRHVAAHAPLVRRLETFAQWQLDVPLQQTNGCDHGGSFFGAIGERFDSLDRRKNVINADVLDAWFDPSPKVLAALGEHLPWLVRTSPPTGAEGLRRTIAEVRGVEPANVLPGAGSSDLIYLALRQWVTPASRVLILDPMYGEYAHLLERVIGCRVDRLALHRADGYALDPNRLREQLQRGYDMVVLVNPNSPTGRHLPQQSLQGALAEAPCSTRFWIDETYVEYVGADQSLERFAADSDQVVVCKSMSKVYALSGARVAYLCGPARLIEQLRPLNPPWAVSLPGQVAAVMALQDPDYYARCYRQTHQLRAELRRGLLGECGLDVVESVANFLLCHLPPDAPTAARVASACRRRDLFIRDVSNMGRCLGSRALRIAVKDRQTNRRIVTTLSEILQQARRASDNADDRPTTRLKESATCSL